VRPSDLPPPEHWPHGVRARYVSGCHCDDCKRAAREYEHTRALARIRGDWNGLVGVRPARRHLQALSRRGVGYKTVAIASDVSRTVIADILSGSKKQVRARTAKRILAVTPDAIADHALVPAKRTWQLVGRLRKEGFTKAAIAQRIGHKMPALQIGKERVLARTALAVEKLYRLTVEVPS
jgi:hypothetical protein